MNGLQLPVLAASMMPEYLCEIGAGFYQQGRYEEALHEFRKALIINPDYEPALVYIELIQNEQTPSLAIREQEIPVASQRLFPQKSRYSRDAITEALDLFEHQRQPQAAISSFTPELKEVRLPPAMVIPAQRFPPKIITLDASLSELIQPIEIEQNKSIVIIGRNIQRFLVTQPETLYVEQQNPDELMITGKDLGYTYFHVWDNSGRSTLEFFTAPPKPEGPTLEEEMRKEIEASKNFKFRYYMDWDTFFAGKRFHSLERQFYSFNHTLSLNGATPYGNLDSTIAARRLKEISEVTYYTLGLEKGTLGFFNDFSLRVFDLQTGIYNMAFSNPYLRGVVFKTPVFNKKLDYTVFWGRDKAGTYGSVAPGVASNDLDSFISGAQVNFTPEPKQKYYASAFHGWGKDRTRTVADLNAYGYDAGIDYTFDDWTINWESAYDSETLAHLFSTTYKVPQFSITNELREIDKDFKTMTGQGSRAGEIGLLSTFNFIPAEKWYINGQFNLFKDKLFPSLDNRNRLNQNLNVNAVYTPDTVSSTHFDYIFQNELGRLSEIRYLSPGVGYNRTLDWGKKINTFVNYRFQRNENFTAPSLDYINHKINTGLRFALVGDLYYFLNKELNWLDAKANLTKSKPNSLETGVDWLGQVFNTRLKLNTSFLYHNEEDTISPLSFLSGEDYIEAFTEFTYPIGPYGEAYLSSRVRNIWADNPAVNKHLEAELRGGLRYTWDTGVKWEAVGDIRGYVFRDLNSDGIRQNDEAPVQGITLWLGKDVSATTDEFGYYVFPGVRGQTAHVMLDSSTLPTGFVLTVPLTQDTPIRHHGIATIDFGLIARTEITGFIFEDTNDNNELNKGEKPVAHVVVTLENGMTVKTNQEGRYTFTGVTPGEHTITIDLNSLPVYYLPKVAITAKIVLNEGVPYIYSVPLKRTKE